ncbi:putative reverse transcriptase Ty1/copia-type domain-containing protein [Phytophthora infestans]|uniref:Putative reverse transcriptase Ty1/copia-type domain-containing protein n=1 Tax=Phytophthora infestans TaxID=4787 RepID=A0A833TD59_PHYIN|nr:putative reverse transcriptase Ty1/copia-type domain-containing protein [Phytophthora infestans]KAF4134569.1 putative reverse transcriptase Ty1/copia-type domain-containing protein [Phytophthora infestans]
MADLMIIIVNVDESWVFALRDEGLPSFTTFMEGVNKVNSLEDVSHCLGLDLQWSPAGDQIPIGQHIYAKTILARFSMDKTQPVRTPMEERFTGQLFILQELTDFVLVLLLGRYCT